MHAPAHSLPIQSHYTLDVSDSVHVIYNLFIAAFSLFNIAAAPALCLAIALAHISIVVGILWFSKKTNSNSPRNELSVIGYHYAAIVLYFFEFSILLSPFLTVNYDPMLARADRIILGSLYDLLQRISLPRMVVELLQICYVCFYFLPLTLIVALVRTKRDVVVIGQPIVVAFCITYVGYFVVPAYGPRDYFADSYDYPLLGTLTYDWLQSFLRAIEGRTPDVFPSGHTAVTLIVLHLAFVHLRRMFAAFLVIGAGIIVATVLLRYHYVVDVFAGVVVYLLIVIVCSMDRSRANQRRR